MGALTVLLWFCGTGFAAFGYQIALRGEYYLIRSYTPGKERSARLIGFVLLFCGVACITAGVLSAL